ncbi:MAG: hypothetical protein AAFY48_09995 [Bacteroidota bacterium]
MRLLLFLLLIALPFLLMAQFQSGSPYSAYGVGDLHWQGRGQSAGLAGAGIGLRSDAFLNLTNPAAYTAMRSPYSMALETGFSVLSRQLTTATEDALQRDGGMTDIVLWLRPAKKWATVVGLEPYSQVGYSILTQRQLDNVESSYQLLNEGEGGLTRLFWGNAWQLAPQLSVGLNANFIFGSISQQERFLSTGQLGNFEVQSETVLRGFNFDGGLQWAIPLGADEVTFGVVLQTDSRLWSRTDRELLSGIDLLESEGDGNRDNYRVPVRYGFGSTYRRPNWLITAEASYENWASLGLASDATFVDTWSGTLAMEIAPFKDVYQDYFEAFTLRAGFSYRNSYLEIEGQSFGHWLASLGMGVPLGPQRNHLHLSYSFQNRGTPKNGLIAEQTHQITLGFTIRDVWFLQRKFN